MDGRRQLRCATARVLAALTVAALALALMPGRGGQAAGVVVNLRCADVAGLLDAMAHPTPGTVINLDTDKVAGCTYTLTALAHGSDTDGLPPVTTPLTINAQGSTIARSSTTTTQFRIFEVTPAGTLTLDGATITGGTSVTLGFNFVAFGAAIANAGKLTLLNSTVAGNSSGSGGGGGAIANTSGRVTLVHSTVTGNSGGGIASHAGIVSITNSNITGNSAFLGTGGIDVDGGANVTLTNSSVMGNSGYFGGGIHAENSTVTLVKSVVSGNTAQAGGGIFSQSDDSCPVCGSAGVAVLTLLDSVVSNNVAISGDGGGINAAQFLLEQGAVLAMTLTGSTVSGNTASGRGGGIYVDDGTPIVQQFTIGGAATLVDVSLRNNHASSGGGIYNAGRTIVAAGSTFSGNTPNSCAPTGSVVGCRG